MTPFRIAVIGGECTGKTVLCEELAARLPGLWVPEYLREFVDQHGRVPLAGDQSSILATQIERAAAATDAAVKAALRWVACDSAPIATAIYSEMYFADRSLYAAAERHHAGYVLTLLTGLDLPWEPDGLQRDGPAVRVEFHGRVEAWLQTHSIRYALIEGTGDARTASAVSALRALEFAPR